MKLANNPYKNIDIHTDDSISIRNDLRDYMSSFVNFINLFKEILFSYGQFKLRVFLQ